MSYLFTAKGHTRYCGLVRGKITESGTPNRLNCCPSLMAYIQFTYVAAGRIVKPTITHFECVFCSLCYPARNAHAPSYVVSSVACSALPYFSTVSHKRHDIREKATEHKMCILIFCTVFVSNISHSKKNSVRYYL